MEHEQIILTPDGRVTLTAYIHYHSGQSWGLSDNWQPKARPGVLILPGGAYTYCSDREAEPVALRFMAAGFQAFVLRYSVAEDSSFPAPLHDVSRAVWEIRRRAEEWHINPAQIAVGGFSAGGSLAAMLATQWNTAGLCDDLAIPAGGNMPNALLLFYALTGTGPEMFPPPSDREGKTPPGKILRDNPPALNVCNFVGPHVPPAFLWHTFEDDTLTINNPLGFAQALTTHNVPFELHIFQHGQHGLALNDDLTAYRMPRPAGPEAWVALCIRWLKTLFDF